ncbi:hypothetical protein AM1_F0150 (plasmid) [Acaryochloris marina MBIC11017]|uniref:Uncharacterized protein n=1 Tax=Acaryochloris marina (strain MBIC 11017) TaxID=329726 RepID=A8ZPU3_ACAM1|nr:hypothetical protein AM1_F0150 [Acaryochloris marina MBIC11017]
MQTAILRVGDASLLVTPDGKPLPHKDAEQPTFHIMPKLFNTGAGIGLENITLYGAHVLAFGKSGDDEKDYINVLPKDVRLTNPCPNIRYVIAGTADRKMGWDIPLDPSKPPQQLRLWWLLETQTDSTIIEHYIDLEFELTQRGNVFSMASLNFAVGEGPRAVSFVDPEQACEFFTRNDPAYQIGYKGADLIIRQSNKIQSCAWSDLGLEEFEEMVHLRDMTPVDKHLAKINYIIIAVGFQNSFHIFDQRCPPPVGTHFNPLIFHELPQTLNQIEMGRIAWQLKQGNSPFGPLCLHLID